MTSNQSRVPLFHIFRFFFKLGIIGFGGPAAHIAIMEEELVTKRNWLSRQYFLDLVGGTNLIPGPNSTEMAIHIGYVLRGWKGLLLAGGSFILPAICITLGLAWFYLSFGSLPELLPLLYGIKPVVISIIIIAITRLGKKAGKSLELLVLGGCVFLIALLGVSEILALFAGGISGMFLLTGKAKWFRSNDENLATHKIDPIDPDERIAKTDYQRLVRNGIIAAGIWLLFGLIFLFFVQVLDTKEKAIILGAFFYFVGSILYGSGYVLIAFIEGGLVRDFQYLTESQLIDAVAIGQLKPGPIFATATFIGYLIAGVPGAIFATFGIFTPSFLMVIALNPALTKLRSSIWTSNFLDSVNISAVGLMLVITFRLGFNALIDVPSLFIGVIAMVLLLKYKINPFWLVILGGVLGYLRFSLL